MNFIVSKLQSVRSYLCNTICQNFERTDSHFCVKRFFIIFLYIIALKYGQTLLEKKKYIQVEISDNYKRTLQFCSEIQGDMWHT